MQWTLFPKRVFTEASKHNAQLNFEKSGLEAPRQWTLSADGCIKTAICVGPFSFVQTARVFSTNIPRWEPKSSPGPQNVCQETFPREKSRDKSIRTTQTTALFGRPCASARRQPRPCAGHRRDRAGPRCCPPPVSPGLGGGLETSGLVGTAARLRSSMSTRGQRLAAIQRETLKTNIAEPYGGLMEAAER